MEFFPKRSITETLLDEQEERFDNIFGLEFLDSIDTKLLELEWQLGDMRDLMIRDLRSIRGG